MNELVHQISSASQVQRRLNHHHLPHMLLYENWSYEKSDITKRFLTSYFRAASTSACLFTQVSLHTHISRHMFSPDSSESSFSFQISQQFVPKPITNAVGT